jgi:recombination protein RecR
LSPKVRRLVKLLSRLPGVGEKTAQRYVLWLLTADDAVSRSLGDELRTLRDELGPCERCGNIAEIRQAPGAAKGNGEGDGERRAVCDVCLDGKRDGTVLCVVARVHDLMAIERAGSMRGRYFVLGRLLSPLEGIGPDDLPLAHLIERIKTDGVTEVIVATPPSVDGEATALLLKRELSALGVALTRIASGVPHGGDLEFADPITMGRALSGRRAL